MTDLFQAREAHAARQLFYFMAGRDGVDARVLTQAWRRADLGLETRALRRAVANAADAWTVVEKDTDEGAAVIHLIMRARVHRCQEIGCSARCREAHEQVVATRRSGDRRRRR